MGHTVFEERHSRRFHLAGDVDWQPQERGGRAFYEVLLTGHQRVGRIRGEFHLLTVERRSGLHNDGGCDDPIEEDSGVQRIIWGHVNDAIREAIKAADDAKAWLWSPMTGESMEPGGAPILGPAEALSA